VIARVVLGCPFFKAYRKGDYSGARTFAVKFNMPGFYFTQPIL
jgi:hypothetical protein